MTSKLKLSDLGYNHLEPGNPDNPKNYRICGAGTRGDETLNEYCARPAGWGTDHPGVGRCKLHGGTRSPGRYSALWRGRMAQIARAALEQEADGDPLDLLAELEVQRVLLATLIDQLQPGAAQAEPREVSRVEQVILDEMNRKPKMSRNMKRKLGLLDVNGKGGDGGVVVNADVMVPMVNPLTEFSSSDDSDFISSASSEEVDVDREFRMMRLVDQVRMQVNDIVTTVSKIVGMRNQTAITKAEVAYLVMLLREGMEKFVPKENREPYVRWILENIPGMGKKGEEVDNG